MRNCKEKATEIAQFLHARIGTVLAINEDSMQEWEGASTGFGDDYASSMQQKIDQITLHVTVNVTATFEMTSKTKTKDA